MSKHIPEQILQSMWRYVKDMHVLVLSIRLQHLPLLSLHVLGTYHQYDTLVYPKRTKASKSWSDIFKKPFTGWIGQGSTSQEEANKVRNFKPLSQQETSEFCLKVYLSEYEEKLCSGDFSSIPITAESITHIFDSLCHQVVIRQGSQVPTPIKLERNLVCFFFLPCYLMFVNCSLFQSLERWLESIVTCLQGRSAESPQKQLASAVLIVYCITLTKINIADLKFTIPLLKMLCLSPDLKEQKCPDYEHVCKLLPKECWYITSCIWI